MKMKGNFILKAAGCIALSVIAGCLLMILAYMLPVERIRENVAKSSKLLEREGSYFQWAEGYKNAKSDNYTDTSLYLNAMYPGTGNLAADAMNNPRRLYGEDNNEESAVLMANGRKAGEGTHDVNYGRYWHGSLILLKPLLQLFDLSDIRFFTMIIHMGLLFVVVDGFSKRGLQKPLMGFFASVILLNPVTMVMCFCFSVEYTIMLAGTALVVHFYEYYMEKQRIYFLFLWLGIVTVYFNELSFPMITFGIPLITYLLLSGESGWKLVKQEVLLGTGWGAGYLFMWMGKWICAWIFTGYNYFAEALWHAEKYTSNHATLEAENPTLADRLWKNVSMYAKWPFAILAVAIVVLILVCAFRAKATVKKECLLRMLPWFLIALFPFGIFTALGNGYSYVHYWFTHRLLAISAFAGVCMLLQTVEGKSSGASVEYGRVRKA